MENFKFEIKDVCATAVKYIDEKSILKTKVVLNSGDIGEASLLINSDSALSSVERINTLIKPLLIGVSALDQSRADSIMIALSPPRNRSKYAKGENFSVSVAICRAAANLLKLPLYRYVGGASANTLPLPIINVDDIGIMLIPNSAEGLSNGMKTCNLIKCASLKNASENKEELSICGILNTARAMGYCDGKDFIAIDVKGDNYNKKDNIEIVDIGEANTVSEVCDWFLSARSSGKRTVIKNDNFEASDEFLSDISVALGADYIKKRIPKELPCYRSYKRLLKIENELFSPSYSSGIFR